MKKEDELTKIAERYCIYSLLEKNKSGMTFKQIKYAIKMKESRLKSRLIELESHNDIFYNNYLYKANLNIGESLCIK